MPIYSLTYKHSFPILRLVKSKFLSLERWGEALFKIDDEEIVLEVSVEDSVIVAIMATEDAVWKSTLEGLKQILKREIKAR